MNINDFSGNDVMSIIHRRLDQLGMTQRELAERIGCTEVSVSRWIYRKRIPNINNVISMLNALDLDFQIAEINYISVSKF